jgi:hypothetical protein
MDTAHRFKIIVRLVTDGPDEERDLVLSADSLNVDTSGHLHIRESATKSRSLTGWEQFVVSRVTSVTTGA